MKPKTYIIAGVVIAVIVVAYFMFFKTKTAGASTARVAIGTKKDGTPYYQADVDKVAGDIRGSAEWTKSVQQKATAQGKTLADMINLDAKWMIENA